MKNYVVGFVFSKNKEHMLLIHKLRPEWQKGFLNGLGGKVEEGEDAFTAMERELQEESGLEIKSDRWTRVGKLYSPTFDVDVFGTIYEGEMDDAETKEEEIIEWVPVKNLPKDVLENIPWLMYITLDKIENNHFEAFKVEYKR